MAKASSLIERAARAEPTLKAAGMGCGCQCRGNTLPGVQLGLASPRFDCTSLPALYLLTGRWPSSDNGLFERLAAPRGAPFHFSVGAAYFIDPAQRSKSVRTIQLVVLIFFTVALAPGFSRVRAQRATENPYKQFDPSGTIHYPRSHSFHVKNYRLDLSFDFAKGEVKGTDTVTFQPFSDGLAELQLDSSGLTIDKVNLAGGAALQFRKDDNHIYIALDHPYSHGSSGEVQITYHGNPAKGLYFVRRSEAYPDSPPQIWSHGEEEDNHYWFPCYDSPNDKSTTEIVASVPGDWVVVSNGKLVSEKRNPDGTKVFDWVESVPHSIYLTSIVAGPFIKFEQHAGDKPVTYYVAPGVDESTALRSFGGTPDMISVYTKLLGVPYPYEKYAQSAVSNFIAGGEENVSATTQTDTTLHDETAERDKYSSQGLVAHELAHQWFGDLVTTEDWPNIWLNEGFATFMEAQYTLAHDGEDEYRGEIFRNGETYQQEDRGQYRRPIVERRYTDDGHLFDRTTYQKGSVVLDMLDYVLGHETLFRGLNHYLSLYREKSVTTADLIKALGEATGQDLNWFFNEWVYGAGYPEYKVNASWDPSAKMEHIKVAQTQVLQEDTPLFRMPVDISITTASGTRLYEVVAEGREQDLYFPAESSPLMVLFDAGNRVLKSLDFDKSEGDLIYQLEHDQSCVGRIWAVRALAKKTSSQAAAEALGRALARDSFWNVRQEAADALGAIKTDHALAALIAAPPDSDGRVRTSVILALGGFEKNPDAIQAIRKAWSAGDSYRVGAAAMTAIASVKAPDAFDVLQAGLTRPSYLNMIARNALFAMASLNDKRVVPLAIEAAAPDKPSRLRQTAIQVLGMAGKGDESAYNALVATAHDPFVTLRRTAYTSLGQIGNLQALALLKQAAATEADSGTSSAATAAIVSLTAGAGSSAALQLEIRELRRKNQELEQRLNVLEQKH
jgi:aminopeptidase N